MAQCDEMREMRTEMREMRAEFTAQFAAFQRQIAQIGWTLSFALIAALAVLIAGAIT